MTRAETWAMYGTWWSSQSESNLDPSIAEDSKGEVLHGS